MVRNMIKILPDGPVIGDGGGMNVRQCSLGECVNAETELAPGSVCCASLEATVQVDGTRLEAGTEVALYKVEDDGTPVAAGTFTLERPTRISAALCKITAYDHVAKLDRDLSQWLQGLSGWPYTLIGFAGMVCSACGLELATTQIPNGSFPVRKFYKAGVTGRQLLQWVGEMACRFCRADAQGRIVLEWYRESEVEIRASGERYFFAGSLSYEDYEVAAIDAVKVALADSDAGALWPEGAAENPYVISGNPLALALVDEDLIPYLEVIRGELAALPGYRPCKVSFPAAQDVRPGDILTVVDRYGVSFRTCVMSKVRSGQKDTLECTGSARRDSTTNVNGKSVGQVAQAAVDGQTQEQIFRKLTGGGKVQGLMLGEDGNIYLNVSYAVTGMLAADRIDVGSLVAQKLRTVSGDAVLEVRDGVMQMSAGDAVVVQVYYNEGGPEIMLTAGGRISRSRAGGIDLALSEGGEMAGIGVEELEGQLVGAVYADVFRQRSADVAPRLFGYEVEWKHIEGVGTVLVAKVE